jgi:hypothetical protein
LLDLTSIDCNTGGKMKVFSIKLGRPTIMMLALLFSFLLLSPTQSASAACKEWIGGGTTDWNNGNNWSGGTVPNGDDVCLRAGISPDPIISSVIANPIKSLTIPGAEKLQITSGSLTITGDIINNGTFENLGGSVVMNGSAAQTIGGTAETSFNNLVISNANGVTLGANADVIRTLTLTSGNLVLGSKMLTMGTSASVAGTPSASNMIDASGTGVVRKEFGSTGSFVYPIGTPGEYSPITVNITGGIGGSNKHVDARVSATAESHVNTTGTSYLERHWLLSDSSISGLSADLTMTYVTDDVQGAGAFVGGFYNTSANQWVVGTLRASSLGGGTVSVSNLPTLTGNATGGSADALAVQLASFSAIFTGEHVLVEWGTVFELNNLGFNLYRSTSADSLGTKINDDLIESQAPGSGQGSLYEHQDSNIESDMTYFYTLEDVDVNGVSSRHGWVSVDTSNIATAVTLEEIGTSSPSQSAALYLLLGSVLLGGVALTRSKRSRRRA